MVTVGELLAAFDAFVVRQESRQGARKLGVGELDGLQVAQAALEDIIAGRMR